MPHKPQFFLLNLNQINDANWISGGQMHQSDSVYTPVTPKVAPLAGNLPCNISHRGSSKVMNWLIFLVTKPWSDPVLLAHWGSIRLSSATLSKLEVLKVYYIEVMKIKTDQYIWSPIPGQTSVFMLPKWG